MKSLTIEHLEKTYFDPYANRQVTAIRDISLTVDAGDFVSVVEILLGMIVLGVLWYLVDSWVLAPIERATGERWGLVTRRD